MMSLARLVLYATLGTLLGVLGHTWDTVEFWLIMALFLVVERITHIELIDQLNEELEEMRRSKGLDNEQ
jgi:hypothetical protein